MYTATVTITGKAGPGITVTAEVFTGCNAVKFNVEKSEVEIEQNGKTIIIAVATTLTVTVTVSAGNYTITIS